jgi:serine phosphatase RsbU (regulator of sigma subunit)
MRGMLPVILVLSAAIFAITLLGARTAVRTLSGQVIARTMAQTEARLQRFFDPAVQGLGFARAMGEAGLLPIEEPDAVNAALAPVLEQHPQITSLMVADERGREHMLLKLGERWNARQTRVDLWGERSLWLEWSKGEKPYQEWRVDHYDPRERPWYVGAREAGGAVHWTRPYVFFTTKDPGITASVTFDAGAGITGTLGFDLMLRDITRFTQALTAGPNGKVFVTTDDGRLLGLPALERFERKGARLSSLLETPEEIGEPLILDATAALAGSESGPVRFDSEGQAWIGASRPFHLDPGTTLRVVVAVPESDLVGGLASLRWWIIGLTVVAMVVAAWRTGAEARRVSRPIRAIVGQTERIARGDLSKPQPVSTSIEEVHRLAQSQEHMRASLNTLLKLERDLQLARQIQQDTFPKSLPVFDELLLDAWSEPAEETGGDTYDVVATRRAGTGDVMVVEGEAERLYLLLADAVGHGIGPALLVTQVRAMLRMAVRTGASLDQIVTHLNEQLCDDLTDGRFITMWIAELDASTHVLRAFSAGQAPLLHHVAVEDRVRSMPADAPPLGVLPGMDVELPPPVELARGDVYAVVSDGIFEARNPQGEMFGAPRVSQLMAADRDATPARILQRLRAAVDEFTEGAPADDDRTAIVLKRV